MSEKRLDRSSMALEQRLASFNSGHRHAPGCRACLSRSVSASGKVIEVGPTLVEELWRETPEARSVGSVCERSPVSIELDNGSPRWLSHGGVSGFISSEWISWRRIEVSAERLDPSVARFLSA
jgi:hypothetical protein